MAFDADLIFDRRRLKRQLTFWRLVALAALVALVVVSFARFAGDGLWRRDYVARLTVDGLILDDAGRLKALRALEKSPHAKALIVAVDSPGGTFTGGEALYEELRRLAKTKPVVAVMGGTATSAAYMISAATDHIVARRGTITGSIGVILQTADVTGLLDKLGVKPETFKSGPLKAQPNPLEPLGDKARQATQDLLMELYGQFVDIVAQRRGMARDKVLTLADGRVFTGISAKAAGLVDAIGDETAARAWLAKARGIAETLPVHEVDTGDDGPAWRDVLTLDLKKALFSERVRLDGVFSLWHPSL